MLDDKENTIDFVITWVDGNDEKWLEEKKQFQPIKTDNASSKNRYRDWGILRYWFRGVEKFAPWVNKIYFITYGHLPEWLNVNNRKLVIVKHTDYIPIEYLPTYNSNAIEMNIFRIKELSEKFVNFNDDMFIINKTRKEDFFKNDKPCDLAGCNINMPDGNSDMISHIMLNNVDVINKYYKKNEVIKRNFSKWFNFKYGKYLLRTIFLLPWPKFSNFQEMHMPSSLLKTTINEIYDLEKKRIEETSQNKFRSEKDINQWLFRYWNIVNGNFIPRSYKFGKYFDIDKSAIKSIKKTILSEKNKVICLNDSKENIEFEELKKELIKIFEEKFPEKSKFEKK